MDNPELELQTDKVAVNLRPDSAETILKIVTVAENLVKQGQFDQALEKLNQAATLKPDSARIYTLRAEVYRQKGQLHKALADLDHTIDLSPGDGQAYMQRGEIYRLLKQPQEALHDLNQAVKLVPNNPLVLGRRGTIYRNLKNFPQALADYNQALKLAPTNTWLYGNRAETYRGLKDYPHAIADYNQVLKLSPSARWVYARRSYPYLWVGNLELAGSDFKAAWKVDPTDLMHGWMAEWTGMCQPDFSFSPEARDRLKSLANAVPNHYAAFLCRASLYWWLRVALRESYTQAEKACNMLPTQPEAYFWKGLAAAGLKEDDEAVFLLQRALDLGLPPALFAPLEWLRKVNPELYEKVYRLVGVAKPITENSRNERANGAQKQAEPRPAEISEFTRTGPETQPEPIPVAQAEVSQLETTRKIPQEQITPAPQATETGDATVKLNVTPENVKTETAPPELIPAPVIPSKKNPGPVNGQPGETAGNGQEKAGENNFNSTLNDKSVISAQDEQVQPEKPVLLPLPEELTLTPVESQGKPANPVDEANNKQENGKEVTPFKSDFSDNSVSTLKKSSLLKPVLIVMGLLIAGLLVFLLVFNLTGQKSPAANNPVAVAITPDSTTPTAVAQTPTIPATVGPTTRLTPPPIVLSPVATATSSSEQTTVSVTATQQSKPTAVLDIEATPSSVSAGSTYNSSTTASITSAAQTATTTTPAATLTVSPASFPSTVTVAATTKPPVAVSTLTGPASLSPAGSQVLTGHSGMVTTAGWSRDGRYLATGSEDKTIKIWETATQKEVLTLAPKNAPQAGSPVALNWSSNNEYLVSGWADNHVRVFTVFPAGTTSNTTDVTDNVLPQAVGFSADNILVTYPGKDVLHTQNISNNTKGPDFSLGGVTRISAVKFSLDNKFLAAGLSDGRTVIWDRATLKSVLAILPDQNGGPDPVDVLDWTSDNKYLVVGSQKNLTVYQINLTGGGKIINFPITQAVKAPVSALSLSTDNNLLAVGYRNGDLQLWSISQNQLVGQLNSGSEPILSLNFNSDHHQISAIKGGNQPALLNYLYP